MMKKLRKSLSESSKARRHRRNWLNLQITSLAWFVEFVGYLFICLSKLILRHESNISEFVLVQAAISIYVIILPSIYLINDDDIKGYIVESAWYQRILRFFGLQYNFSLHDDPEVTDKSISDVKSHKEKDIAVIFGRQEDIEDNIEMNEGNASRNSSSIQFSMHTVNSEQGTTMS